MIESTDLMHLVAKRPSTLRFVTFAFFWTYLVLVLSALADAQVIKNGDCVVDTEILGLPKCAIESRDNKLYVSKQFLPMFFSNDAMAPGAVTPKSEHLAWTHLPDGGWAYFNRNGLVVVQNVATNDNGPSEFHLGLVRITNGKKWGLSNAKGRLILPLKYDGILEYQEGKGWLVCSGCHIENEIGGEYQFFKGGEWSWLDRHGRVSRAASEPRSTWDQKAQD